MCVMLVQAETFCDRLKAKIEVEENEESETIALEPITGETG